MSDNGNIDMPVDLRYLDDTEILHSSTDNVNSVNLDVMDCLPSISTQAEFDAGISSTVDTPGDADLPVFGPLGEFESQVYTEGDIQDANSVPGVCGLRNLGNTCYMNAGLQCLFNNKIFLSFFVENSIQLYEEGLLTNQFIEIMKKVWTGQYSVLDLTAFKDAYGKIHPQFQNYRQHDCQEFLALLLDSMHEQLLTSAYGTVINSNTSKHAPPYCHKLIEKKSNHNSSSETEYVAENLCTNNDRKKANRNEDTDLCSDTNKLTLTLEKHSEVGSILKSLLHTETVCVQNPCVNSDTTSDSEKLKCDKGIKKIISSVCDSPVSSDSMGKINNMLKDSNNLDEILSKNELNEDNIRAPENLYKQKLSSAENNKILSQNETKKLEKNQIACKINASRKIPSIEDFVKDTKTLNTNVLINDEANNLLKFDSEKFPKYDHNRLQETVDNLSGMSDFYTKQSTLKRVKVTNLIHDATESNSSDASMSSFVNKRLKIEDHCDKKNCDGNASDQEDAIDMEQSVEEYSEESSQSSELNAPGNENSQISLAEEVFRANSDWEKYRSGKQSVIIDNFHGQFRSSVVCSQCSHVSIFYEPFMYLPVPLPHALERQIVVTYVQNKTVAAVRFLVNVRKYDKVQKIKEKLLQLLDEKPQEIILAEVFENHISRYLDDNVLVQHVNDISRSVYAFAIKVNIKHLNAAESSNKNTLNSTENSKSVVESDGRSKLWDDAFPTCTTEEPTCLTLNTDEQCFISSYFGGDDNKINEEALCLDKKSTETVISKDNSIQDAKISDSQCDVVQWNSCAICLEEAPAFILMLHPSCHCILCKSCIEVSCKHYGENLFVCPVCSSPVSPTKDFVPLNKLADYKSQISLIPIPIVVRHDLFESQSLKCKNLVGHPGVLKLPTCLPATELYECVDSYIPFLSTYSLLLVDGQGKNCSRCLYTQHCSGCEVARVGDIRLKPGDSLAVRYFDLSKENIEQTSHVSDHKSMQQKRHKSTLTLYDCIEAFSESENLDENSPWFCPACCQNQQAVKSLSVWRWPEVLIICLKRFVFHEYTSMKLDDKVVFPLEGLNLKSFTTGPSDQPLIYDLQACVCHFGSVSSGHYTSYSKHALTGEWYYYSDEVVTKQAPNTDECVNEYILFYQRR